MAVQMTLLSHIDRLVFVGVQSRINWSAGFVGGFRNPHECKIPPDMVCSTIHGNGYPIRAETIRAVR
jgi:hypothetical protein